MIDFHSHLDLYPGALNLLAEVSRRNAFTFVVTTSPRAYVATSRVFAHCPNVHVGLGLHPEVASMKANEEDALVREVASAKLIGEIGLDGSARFRESLSTQERIFERVVRECEHQGGRVMSIHSRGAEARVLQILGRYPQAGTPVLHWFSGGAKDLETAIKLGCWFSIGPAMMRGEKGRQIAARIPMDRVLPETDGPFTQQKGQTLMPWDAWTVRSALAETWQVDEAKAGLILQRNLLTLLGPKLAKSLEVSLPGASELPAPG